MHLHFSGKTYDLSAQTDISISVRGDSRQLSAFHIPPAAILPLKMGEFTGSVSEGGPVNCFHVRFNPHGNGTHTECVGHISREHHSLLQAMPPPLMECVLLTLTAKQGISAGELKQALDGQNLKGCRAIVIRTLPNEPDKPINQYSGNNPGYFHPDCMDYLVTNGIEHLITDLPSVDPEEDGGALLCHHRFWNYPQNPRTHFTITELVYVPSAVPDGNYLLNLQVAAMNSDASPSRPLLFPLATV